MEISSWLTIQAVSFSSSGLKITLGIFLILCLLGIVSKILVKKKSQDKSLSRVLERFYHWGLVLGILDFILSFFNFEAIPLLGARFWYLFLLVGGLIWLGFILKHLFVRVPRERENKKKRQSFEQYLP